MSALVFAAVSAVIVTVAPSPASTTFGRYSARELTDLYRELPEGDERRQVADAIDDRSHELLVWLHDEEDFHQRLAGPRHCLTEQHETWLAHVRFEIDAAISALDSNSPATKYGNLIHVGNRGDALESGAIEDQQSEKYRMSHRGHDGS